MGKRQPLSIGAFQFSTKSEAKEFIRTVRDRYKEGEIIVDPDDSFLRDLVALHPRSHEKLGVGISHFTVDKDKEYGTTRCFYIVRTDGSDTDVSFNKCLDGEEQSTLARSAMRTAIFPQVQEYKRSRFANGSVFCPFLDIELSESNTHIDHASPNTFQILVKRWLELENFTIEDVAISGSADNSFARIMTDSKQLDSWRKFHNENAQLRAISQLGNLSHAKIEFNKSKKQA